MEGEGPGKQGRKKRQGEAIGTGWHPEEMWPPGGLPNSKSE